MKKAIVLLMLLSGCATPVTAMRKGDSVVTCGGSASGSAIGGYIGYNIQKSHDKDCVDNYAAQGYVVAKP